MKHVTVRAWYPSMIPLRLFFVNPRIESTLVFILIVQEDVKQKYVTDKMNVSFLDCGKSSVKLQLDLAEISAR